MRGMRQCLCAWRPSQVSRMQPPARKLMAVEACRMYEASRQAGRQVGRQAGRQAGHHCHKLASAADCGLPPLPARCNAFGMVPAPGAALPARTSSLTSWLPLSSPMVSSWLIYSERLWARSDSAAGSGASGSSWRRRHISASSMHDSAPRTMTGGSAAPVAVLCAMTGAEQFW